MRVVGEYLLMMAVSRAMQADDHHSRLARKLGGRSAIRSAVIVTRSPSWPKVGGSFPTHPSTPQQKPPRSGWNAGLHRQSHSQSVIYPCSAHRCSSQFAVMSYFFLRAADSRVTADEHRV
jgi:hypothetical protein